MGTFTPKGLFPEENNIYDVLHQVKAFRTSKKQNAANIFVISDIAKDYDDLVAWIILKELHRLGLIKLKGFIANMKPSKKRAEYGRGVLDTLLLHEIPVAEGTSALDVKALENHQLQDHEFEGVTFLKAGPFQSGEDLLRQVLKDSEKSKQKIELVLLSSLLDIGLFADPSFKKEEFLNLAAEQYKKAELEWKKQVESEARLGKKHNSCAPKALEAAKWLPQQETVAIKDSFLLVSQVSRVHMQGGYHFKNHKLFPNEDAANNKFHWKAAQKFHAFLDKNKIESTVWTKVPATCNMPIPHTFFKELAKIGHPLGDRLHKQQVLQERAFYAQACGAPEKRHAAFMDQEWYLRVKTTWWSEDRKDGLQERKRPKKDPNDPTEQKYDRNTGEWPKCIEDVFPYLNKLILYDALPALGSAGQDVLDALGVLALSKDEMRARHKIVGVAASETKSACVGINKDRMGIVLMALIRGSLLAASQGLKTAN